MRAIQGPAQGIALPQRQSRSLPGLVPTMWFKHEPLQGQTKARKLSGHVNRSSIAQSAELQPSNRKIPVEGDD